MCKTQPITKGKNIFKNSMSNCYDCKQQQHYLVLRCVAVHVGDIQVVVTVAAVPLLLLLYQLLDTMDLYTSMTIEILQNQTIIIWKHRIDALIYEEKKLYILTIYMNNQFLETK